MVREVGGQPRYCRVTEGGGAAAEVTVEWSSG